MSPATRPASQLASSPARQLDSSPVKSVLSCVILLLENYFHVPALLIEFVMLVVLSTRDSHLQVDFFST